MFKKNKIGKLGMGENAAAMYLSDRVEIFTKVDNFDLVNGEFSRSDLLNRGAFETPINKALVGDIEFFGSKTQNSNHGTVLLLKTEKFKNVFAKKNAQLLSLSLGQTYRKFIQDGKEIYVSSNHDLGERVFPIDPLMMENKETKVFLNNRAFPVPYKISNAKRGNTTVVISAVVLPAKTDNAFIPTNVTNQGIYFVREGREINSAIWIKEIWGEKHNSMNRIRIEINFTSELDLEMGISFQKSADIAPSALIIEALAAHLKEPIEEMKQYIEEQRLQKVASSEQKYIIEKKAHIETEMPEKNLVETFTIDCSKQEAEYKNSTLDDTPSNQLSVNNSVTHASFDAQLKSKKKESNAEKRRREVIELTLNLKKMIGSNINLLAEVMEILKQ
ncbi:hypothetical protein AB4Z17_29965 [Paenibacillus sp. TAF43_2]|uniref:hypothetical protein n=1 Tax=Paenibacillus sp. TAF43_2 TaxID=3233069 RepID=UPI003F995F65